MSYNNPRLKLEMSMMDAIIAFCEGNPGAVNVLCQVLQETARIDPDCAFGPLGPLMSLDNLDCYGSKIWILYKEVCGQDVTTMLGTLRAIQLGIVAESDVRTAIDGVTLGQKPELDVATLVAKVKEKLPKFAA